LLTDDSDKSDLQSVACNEFLAKEVNAKESDDKKVLSVMQDGDD